MLLCLILGLVRFYHRGEKCERRGSTRGRRGSKKGKKRLKEGEGEAQRSRKRGQTPPTPKAKEAKAQAKSRQSPRRSRRAREAAKTPVLGGFPPSFSQFPAQLQSVPLPSFRRFSAQPHHTIKGNEEQQPHSQPHPALQGRHSVVRTGENGYSSVITSAASRIACSSASESLVRGMSMSGVHSPRVCIITFSAVRDWPSERPAWYSFAISFVSS